MKLPKRLFLIDYDGPCVKAGAVTYDTLQEVGNNLLRVLRNQPLTDNDWKKIFAETAGTTELNTIRAIAKYAGILTPEGNTPNRFLNDFLTSREQYLKDVFTVREELDPTDLDQMYADLPFFIRNATTSEDLVWLVTGNPRTTMQQRLRFFPELSQIFAPNGRLSGAFGEEAYTRPGLIQLAIQRAREIGFVPTEDELGWLNNVYYIGDASMDLFAALDSKVRHILIPRDPVHAFTNEEDTPHGRLSVHGKIHNYPYPKQVEEGITSYDNHGPRIIYTGSFYNPYLVVFTRPDLEHATEERLALMNLYDARILAALSDEIEGLKDTEGGGNFNNL